MEDIKKSIKKIVFSYPELVPDMVDDNDNLFGITSARTILYILLDLNNFLGLTISDTTITKLKHFSINNIYSILKDS